MEGKSLTILVISALLMLTLLAGCAPSQTGEVEVQEGQEAQEREKVQEEEEMQETQEEEEEQENQEVQEEQENQSKEFLTEEEYLEEYGKILQCLDEQVPEIDNEWWDYVADKTGGQAHINTRVVGDDMTTYHIEIFDIYRDYEKTEYLGKYYYVIVAEQWEDHRPAWAHFYVSEDFDEVLWCDIAMGEDSEYPVLYLDEWRNSDYYPKLDR